jgi:hypothetical protein
MASVLTIVAADRAGEARIKQIINQLVGQFRHGAAYRTATDGTRLFGATRESRGGAMDPSPDYDVSDEIEFFFGYLTWGLRGVQDGNG